VGRNSALLIRAGNLTASSCMPPARSSAVGIGRSSARGSHALAACLGPELTAGNPFADLWVWLHGSCTGQCAGSSGRNEWEIRSGRLVVCEMMCSTELYFWIKESECWLVSWNKSICFLPEVKEITGWR